jgi:hypothetical protein
MFYLCHLNAQNLNGKAKIANNSQSLKRVYTSDISGNLFMNINIWGSLSSLGQLQVPEGVDMVDILSLIGGPSSEDNYKKIKIIRETPDENNNKIILVDMSEFFKNGDRSNLPKILPNDTIIFKKKIGYSIYKRLSQFSTTVTILTVIINLLILF